MREEESKNVNINENDIIPQSLRIKEFMEEQQNEYDHYVLIDSKDRNFTNHPKANDYVILLGNQVKKEKHKDLYPEIIQMLFQLN